MAYQRKTKDFFDLLANYGYGFEVLTTEETRKAIRQRKQEYIANDSQPATYKIKKYRERIAATGEANVN